MRLHCTVASEVPGDSRLDGPAGAGRAVREPRPGGGPPRGTGTREERKHSVGPAGRRAVSRIGIDGFEQLVPPA